MGRSESSPAAKNRPQWADNSGTCCEGCAVPFTFTVRRHHCRECGGLMCAGCSRGRRPIPALGYAQPVRICRDCVNGTRSLKEAFSDLYMQVGGRTMVRTQSDASERSGRRRSASAVAIANRVKREKRRAQRDGARTSRSASSCPARSDRRRAHSTLSSP